MTAYEKFKALPIDHSAVGLELRDNAPLYYCTPADAQILGWAGVDGIHYCTIPEYGEIVFAVSPMNLGDCVHPIARNFPDLLRLLLCCADMAALEQCYAWDEEQFRAFLIDFPATQEQRAVLNAIQAAFGLEPMEDAFAYVKALQAAFGLARIPYTEDYYDPDMNPAAPVRFREWKVTYDGGFFPTEGQPGEEVPIGKVFPWGEEVWHIPAAYACTKGLVVDFCTEVAPERVAAWIGKWDLLNENAHRYTADQQRQIEQENPLEVDFHPSLSLNGKTLRHSQGSGICWIAPDCLGSQMQNPPEAREFLGHYGLDPSRCWCIRRVSFPWATRRKSAVKALSLHLEREMTDISAARFATPGVGENVTVSHPLTGAVYTLTVQAVESMEADTLRINDAVMEYPAHYKMMTYALEPELPPHSFILRDTVPGDEPRLKPTSLTNQVEIDGLAAAIGIIGGADGPTAVFIGHRPQPNLRAACSSLHFEPSDRVEWEFLFREKLLPDLDIRLL